MDAPHAVVCCASLRTHLGGDANVLSQLGSDLCQPHARWCDDNFRSRRDVKAIEGSDERVSVCCRRWVGLPVTADEELARRLAVSGECSDGCAHLLTARVMRRWEKVPTKKLAVPVQCYTDSRRCATRVNARLESRE